MGRPAIRRQAGTSVRSCGHDRGRRLVWTALCALVVLALAACDRAPASTPPVVKLGLIAPFEGLYRSEGYAALAAVKLAVAQRNAAGGVGGRQVALVALNDDGRAEDAARQAAKLAVDRDVLGAVGPLHLTTARGAGPVLAAADIPWVAPVALEAQERPGGFGLFADPAEVGRTAVATLAEQGIAGEAIVYSDQPSAVAAAEAAGREHGLATRARPPAAAGGTAEAPGGVVWLGDASDGAALVNRLASGGVKPAIVGGPELGSPAFAGRVADHGPVQWLSSGPPVSALPVDFVAAYRELAGADPTPQAVLAYDATTLLLDAMAQAAADGMLDRGAVRQALARLGAIGWQGLSGLVTWDGTTCPTSQPCGQWQGAPLHPFGLEASHN